MTRVGPLPDSHRLFAPDPVIEAYKATLDRSLLRQNLRRSPTERLYNLVALQGLADEVRRAGESARSSP